MKPDLQRGFRLYDRTVLPLRNRITGDGKDAHVVPRTMSVLVCLAEHAGEVVTRGFLDEHVWGRSVVTDQALTNCISELRNLLGDTRAEPRFIETVPKRGYRLIAPVSPLEAGTESRAPLFSRRPLRVALSLGALAAIVVAGIWWAMHVPPGASAAPLTTVAVTPFRQLRGAEEYAYLQLALPDEIATELSRASGLAVRPFQPDAPTDPNAAKAELDANNVITGYYYVGAKGTLAITVQALDVKQNRILWRTQLTLPVADLLSLRNRIARQIRTQLVPALGANPARTVGTQPAKAKAYRIYLHSLALPRDPEHHVQAIAMLRRATTLDPNYAPAWKELANQLRWHGLYLYADGGASAMQKSVAAAKRALSLDPTLVAAAASLINTQSELGAVTEAYRLARQLVLDHPRSALAHYALAEVLRYGGMLQDAERHCEIALQLDPHYYLWRNCALTYIADGKPERAVRYIALDPASYWGSLVIPALKIRQGGTAAALKVVRRLPKSSAHRRFMEACLIGRRGSELDALAQPFIKYWSKPYDGESDYWTAAALAYCGRPQDALIMLAQAIQGHYCAYPALDRDSHWNSLRDNPRFRALRQKAIACHEQFQAAVKPVP
ncbi:MAG: winged helix-turn-helix domain-containing protein [Gammaproteobacteria bacterium]|nr:winged helix-turn-helix domain-containing protein [Gammaproteobacteria bacterium]